jgi:hypothetical protein
LIYFALGDVKAKNGLDKGKTQKAEVPRREGVLDLSTIFQSAILPLKVGAGIKPET